MSASVSTGFPSCVTSFYGQGEELCAKLFSAKGELLAQDRFLSPMCLTSRVTPPVISCSDTYEKFTYYMLQNAIKFLVKKRKDTSVSENSSIFDDHSQTKCVIIPFKGPKNFS